MPGFQGIEPLIPPRKRASVDLEGAIAPLDEVRGVDQHGGRAARSENARILHLVLFPPVVFAVDGGQLARACLTERDDVSIGLDGIGRERIIAP